MNGTLDAPLTATQRLAGAHLRIFQRHDEQLARIAGATDKTNTFILTHLPLSPLLFSTPHLVQLCA